MTEYITLWRIGPLPDPSCPPSINVVKSSAMHKSMVVSGRWVEEAPRLAEALAFMRDHPEPTADDFIAAVAHFGGPVVKMAADITAATTND